MDAQFLTNLSRATLFTSALLLAACDQTSPPSAEPTPTAESSGVAVTPADTSAPTPAMQPTPSGIAPVAPPAEMVASDEADKKPIDMYDLDYDEENDRFLIVGTQTGYSGPVYSMYANGQQESTGALADGVESGKWVTYYENENKETEGAYVRGLEDGQWSYYFENGNLDSSGAYKEGSLTGRWTDFFEDGTVESDGVYVDGLMDGDWKFYQSGNAEPRVVRFDNGREAGR